MKNIIIWDSTEIFTGGTKVSLAIYDLLKKDYNCIFIIPGEGEVSEILREKGIDYKIANIGNYKSSKKDLIDILKLLYYLPFTFYKLYRYIKKKNIVLMYSNAVRYSIWNSLIGNMLCIPVIWHIHHFFEDNKSKFILNRFGKLKSVKKIIFVSNFVENQFPELIGKSKVIYNGIENDDLKRKAKASFLNINKLINVPGNVKIVSVITHIMSTKGQEVLIKAIPIVVKEYPQVHFVIVGRVVDKSCYNYLLHLISKLDVKHYISFLGYCNDVPGLFNNIYINTITSMEGFPLILLESHASGVPTLVPDIGGSLEAIGNGNKELIYEFGNYKDLAQKIIKLLKDEDLYLRIRDDCKKWSYEFDIEAFNQKIKSAIEEVLEGANL